MLLFIPAALLPGAHLHSSMGVQMGRFGSADTLTGGKKGYLTS